jgi:hypothetical protein
MRGKNDGRCKEKTEGRTSRKRVAASSSWISLESSRRESVAAESILVVVLKLDDGVKGGVRSGWPYSRSTRQRLWTFEGLISGFMVKISSKERDPRCSVVLGDGVASASVET